MKSKFYARFTMVFATLLMFTFIASSQTTLVIPIVDVNDSMEETLDDEYEDDGVTLNHAAGYMDDGSSDLELCAESQGLRQIIGLVFRDVQIPAGATVTNAYVQFTVDEADKNELAVTIDIWGGKVANATAPIADTDFGITSVYPKTTTMVPWTPPVWTTDGETGADQQTPDISTVITEIISDPGWIPGNNLIILMDDVDNADGAARTVESFDGAGGDVAQVPTLNITFDDGGGGGGDPISISVQISDIMDDIEEAGEEWSGTPIGTIDDSSSDLEFINEDGLQYVGMIFRNVQIPPNETINSAYIQFYSDKALDGPVTCELYGALEANVAAPFTSDLFSVSIKPSTVASVSWTPGPWGDAGVATEAERSPDISAIIQEIVAIDGWASGNNLMIGARGTSTGKIDNREAVSYDGNPEQAAILNVTYGGPDNTRVKPIPVEYSSLIYPNPTEGKLYINNPSTANFDYEIYTISGRLVSSKQNNTGSTTEVDMSDFVKGMYFVNVRSEGISETHKLILK